VMQVLRWFVDYFPLNLASRPIWNPKRLTKQW
jgi:hypothetical protein